MTFFSRLFCFIAFSGVSIGVQKHHTKKNAYEKEIGQKSKTGFLSVFFYLYHVFGKGRREKKKK
jgi:hypothetical protein